MRSKPQPHMKVAFKFASGLHINHQGMCCFDLKLLCYYVSNITPQFVRHDKVSILF